ncbi:MAG: hypothetical protein BHV87_12660 [Clostridiales bacterium 36_14]|nr:MAG: hypothetical protein BHV87_12660 [Clostridiales bacterium 36_14]
MNQSPSNVNGEKILIKGYVRADGTEVPSYWRRLPGKALMTIFKEDKSQNPLGFAGDRINDSYYDMDDKGFLERLKESISQMPQSEARDNLLKTLNKFDGYVVMQDGQGKDGTERLEEIKQTVTEIIRYLPEGKVKDALSVTNAVAQGLMSFDGIWKQLPDDPSEEAKEILKQELEFVVKSVGQMLEGDFLSVDWGHLVQTLGIGEALNTVNPILGQVVSIAADVVPKVINIVKASKGKDKDLLKIMTNALGLLPTVGSVFGQIGSKVGDKILENPKLAELYHDLKGIDTVSKRFDAYIKNDMPEGSIGELEEIAELSEGLQNKAYELEGQIEPSSEFKSLREKLFQKSQMTGAAAPLTLNGGVDNYDELMQQQDLILLKNLYPDIMSQVDVSQLPMTVDNYNLMQIVDEVKTNIQDSINDFKAGVKQTSEEVSAEGLKKANNHLNRDRPEARLLMDISIDKFKTAKDNSQFIVLQPENNNRIMQQYNLNSPGLAIDPKWHGVAFANDSDMSKKLPQLQKQVMSSFDSNRNIFKTDKIGIELNQDKNLHYSIGHGTILNPYIDNQGYFNGVLYDIYDFDWLDFDFDIFDRNSIEHNKTAAINNAAYYLQVNNKIDKYYILVPIKFKL